MAKFKEIINKIKSIKNYEIIISLIIIAVILLIYFSVTDKKDANVDVKSSNVSSLTDGLEERLEDILSKIDGVGKTDVLITYNSTAEQVTASTSSSNQTTTNNGTNSTTTSTTNSSPIINNKDVIVLQEKMPEIRGVIVVADGARDVKTKMQILSAVSTALDINQNTIQIFTRSDL